MISNNIKTFLIFHIQRVHDVNQNIIFSSFKKKMFFAVNFGDDNSLERQERRTTFKNFFFVFYFTGIQVITGKFNGNMGPPTKSWRILAFASPNM